MKVSVITINYNNVEGLEKTIQSVKSQIFNDYEYIIIDGGSTDGSFDIIKQYKESITYWVSEKDKGIYNAMNKAISIAKGEYLHFLNSGDYYCDSSVLSDIFGYKLLKTDFIRGNYLIIENDVLIKKNNYGTEGLTLLGFQTQAYCHQALFIKKNIFDKFGLYDESLKISADWKHTLIALLHNSTQSYIDRSIAVYDTTGISSNTQLTQAEFKKSWSQIIPNFINQDIITLKKVKQDNFELQTNPLICFLLTHKFPRFVLRCLRKIYSLFGL